jgi:hypothetical protein
MATMMSVTSGSNALTLSRDERVKRFGIECIGPGGGDGIFFKAGTWRPGGEYIQKLIIRNVSTEVKKLKYKLPSTRYFSMSYPEPIILSPGLAQEVDVVFRPVEYEPYDDTIYIKMLDGISGNGFHIPVRATIDNLSLKAPEGLDLGFCATHQISQLTFKLVNTGEIDAPYEWDVPEPFRLVPSSGTVPVGKFHEITLSIRPTDASVFVAQALCHVGRGVHAIIPQPTLVTKLSAIGKFAFISVSDDVVSFDEVVSGMLPDNKEIVLANNSVVPAEFSLIRLDSDRDEVFEVTPKNGIIPPRSEIAVSVSYRPLAMGVYTHDRYAFRTPGNCNTVFNLKGTAMPPKVTLVKDVVPTKAKPQQQTNESIASSSNSTLLTEEGAPHFSLNFRDVEIGRVETRLLFLSNESPREVPFSIIGDERGIFKMTPRQGIIPPLIKSFPVKVVFVPPKPINYYRRFFVLIGDSQPLFYDCLGTGFIRAKGETKEQRPAPIRHAHVQAYRNRMVQGFGGLNPDELDLLHENPEVPSYFFAQIGRIGTKAFSITQLQRPVTRTGESLRNLVAPAHEFFIQGNDSTAKEITVNRLSLDFGFTQFKTSSRVKEVVVHNHTNGKVVVQWYIPIVEGMDRLSSNNNSSTSASNEFKGRDIITIDREEKEIAQLQAFTVHPNNVDINPGQSCVFHITFVPKQSSRNFLSELEAYVYFKNQRTFRLVNDFSLTPPWCLTLNCMGHTFSSGQLLAKASYFGGNVSHNKLVFPCCYLGESIYQTVMIRNTSNLPCTFHAEIGWRAKNSFASEEPDGEITTATAAINNAVFSVKPDTGEIAAESFVLVCVRFSPNILKKHSDVLKTIINGEEGEKLLLEGTGAVPYVIIPDLYEEQSIFPEELFGINKKSMTSYELIPKDVLGTLYMKPTCLGLASTRSITLKNASRLPLKYRVVLPAQATQDNLLEITPAVGILKGNDDIKLLVTFSPQRIKTYNFKVTIQVFPIGGKPKRVMDANQPGAVDPPEVIQECSVIINAVGEMGALLFDPEETFADVRLVHTKEEKSIWLENISDSDLSFQLFYRELFQPDLVEMREEKHLSEIMPLNPVPFHTGGGGATQRKSSTSSTQGGAGAENNPLPASPHAFRQPSLFCEQNKGIIPARSRLRCVFTYNPVKSGLFEFTVFAQVTTAHHQSKKTVMIGNDTAALMKFTGNINLNDLKEMENNQEALSMLPLKATFTARAAFPKLLFEDIRLDNQDLPIATLSALWERFSLSLLNYDLSIPLNNEEILMNNSSSPDLGKLKVYNFEFTPQVVNSPIQVITVRLRNHGYLKTSFHFHLPNEKQLELENWCDEEDPSEELNRLICIIEELKLFSIEPKEKDLLPGESCELKISYRHTSLKYDGLHNIPILVKIAQGKMFYVNVKGQTLAAMNKRSAVKFSTDQVMRTSPGTNPSSPSSRAVTTTGGAGGQGQDEGKKPAGLLGTNPADILLVFPECGTNPYLYNIIRFNPVPLGLSPSFSNGVPLRKGTMKDFAPLQRIELVNVSSSSVNYEILLGHHVNRTTDVATLFVANFIQDMNYDMEVLSIANPTGTIPNNSSVLLDFYFVPLEKKTYSFPFTVKYSVTPSHQMNNQAISSAITATFDTEASTTSPSILIGNGSNNNSGASLMKPPTTGILSRQGGTGGGGTKGRKTRLTQHQNHLLGGGGVAPPTVFEYLPGTIEAVGYDPREVRPVRYETEYIGGVPPRIPILEFPEKPLVLHSDLIDYGIIPQECTVRRVFVLNNLSATQSYEFAIDETSSSLCIDGLLAVRPLFGKVEPRGTQIIELVLKSYSQSLIISENLKIMVREILKASNKSRGGTRQQLLDRIKSSRHQKENEHESVVSHTTMARSMQILLQEKGVVHTNLPQLMTLQEEAESMGITDQKLTASGLIPSGTGTGGEVSHNTSHVSTGTGGGEATAEQHNSNKNNPFEPKTKTASFPVTVNKQGKVVEGNITKAVKSLRGTLGSSSYGNDGLFEEPGGQEFLAMDMGQTANSPPSPETRGSGPRYNSNNNNNSRGAPSSPAKSTRSGATTAKSGTSAGGLPSSGHSLGGSSQGNNQNVIRYGISYSLLLRLTGEIYSKETIETIHKLNEENYSNYYLNRDNEYLIASLYQQRKAFIPLLPRKFFDSDFINEMVQVRSKAKVNISFLENRFSEFRYIGNSLMNSLWSNLLSSVQMSSFIENLVPETHSPVFPSSEALNSHFVPLRETEKINPFSSSSLSSAALAPTLPYGVYFKEFSSSKDLSVFQLFIIELKSLGLSSKAIADSHKQIGTEEEGKQEQLLPWQRMEEKTLLQDQESYSLLNSELLDVLIDWDLADRKEFDSIVASLENK